MCIRFSCIFIQIESHELAASCAVSTLIDFLNFFHLQFLLFFLTFVACCVELADFCASRDCGCDWARTAAAVAAADGDGDVDDDDITSYGELSDAFGGNVSLLLIGISQLPGLLLSFNASSCEEINLDPFSDVIGIVAPIIIKLWLFDKKNNHGVHTIVWTRLEIDREKKGGKKPKIISISWMFPCTRFRMGVVKIADNNRSININALLLILNYNRKITANNSDRI